VDPGEECDDGNALDGVGCTACTCRIEPGTLHASLQTRCLLTHALTIARTHGVYAGYVCHQTFDKPTSVCSVLASGTSSAESSHRAMMARRERDTEWTGLAVAGYALSVGLFALSGLAFVVLAGLACAVYLKPHLRVRRHCVCAWCVVRCVALRVMVSQCGLIARPRVQTRALEWMTKSEVKRE
jgi:cysteine-rich repeat protein